MPEHLPLAWMILHLNSWKDFVLRFLYRLDAFRFGDLATLQISISLPTCFIYLYCVALCIIQRVNFSEYIECIYCHFFFFLSFKKLFEDKNVCIWKEEGKLITIFSDSESFFHDSLWSKERACSVLFETFCATWWHLLGRELSGVWIIAQLDHHLRHFSVLNIIRLSVDSPLCQAI